MIPKWLFAAESSNEHQVEELPGTICKHEIHA